MRLLREPCRRAAPKNFDSRTAISGEIPRLPSTNSDNVVRNGQSQGLNTLPQHKTGGM